MEYSTPEKAGIRSENILNYIKTLENARLATHDVLIMRGDKLIYEAYWKPFDRNFAHRMYSVTKSFVAISIGFLEQEGKLSLDDKISKYFAEELKAQPDRHMHDQTVRHMLMMSTAKTPQDWFKAKPQDRVKFYFQNPGTESRPSGTLFEYDSTGSFVLGALVERLSGMSLIDYLRSRLFDKLGISREAHFLKCPGGHSWGDSALICTPRDLMLTARFMMNKGKWNGEQLLNEKYVTDATSKQISNALFNDDEFNTQGYGYLIWRSFDNSFCFFGMGCQYALCVPDKDLILVYNADNQGKDYAGKLVIESFFKLIAHTAVDTELPEDTEAARELADYSAKLTLLAARGLISSPIAEKINGQTYVLDENPMGITQIRFDLREDGGTLYYTNAQGDKELAFGFGENVFTFFPQDGYADETGTVAGSRRYRCAASACWEEESHLAIKVQIIDTYFGVLDMHFSFCDQLVGIRMVKTAEDFLNEYVGFAGGEAPRHIAAHSIE